MPNHSGKGLDSGFDLARRAFRLQAEDDESFWRLASEVTVFQREHSRFYDRFCASSGLEVPYLPVEAFGLTDVATFPQHLSEATFLSSGTASDRRSRHFVRSLGIYRESVVTNFRSLLKSDSYTLLAHLPGYASESSLVSMASILGEAGGTANGATFFLESNSLLRDAVESRRPDEAVVLLGSAFGLLDLVERGDAVELAPADLVIETGGMKLRRKELTRDDLHDRLSAAFRVDRRQVWGEYGMCEMLSQCYRTDSTGFRAPPWVRFRVLDPDDPTVAVSDGVEGRLAVFDLANVFTVSALLTADRATSSGRGFEVHGRISGAARRGCNFLVASATDAAAEA